jgi:hypothetical protein
MAGLPFGLVVGAAWIVVRRMNLKKADEECAFLQAEKVELEAKLEARVKSMAEHHALEPDRWQARVRELQQELQKKISAPKTSEGALTDRFTVARN